MANPWNYQTLLARIENIQTQSRYAADSPDQAEVNAYAAAFPPHIQSGIAMVLGMTPELRRRCVRDAQQLLTVDRDPDTVSFFGDWLSASEQAREQIILADWLMLAQTLEGFPKLLAILGDGIFSNLPDLGTHHRLLSVIAGLLAPGGRFITRKVLALEGVERSMHSAQVLLSRYRQHKIDDTEFGFGMRITGCLDRYYDDNTYRLDNASIFQHFAKLYAANELSDQEYAAIRRYQFNGDSCIVPTICVGRSIVCLWI